MGEWRVVDDSRRFRHVHAEYSEDMPPAVVSFGKRNLDWVLDYVRRQREHHTGGQVRVRLEVCDMTAEAESSPAEAGCHKVE